MLNFKNYYKQIKYLNSSSNDKKFINENKYFGTS